jgi:nucleotide-binding universal stress UspA family protein
MRKYQKILVGIDFSPASRAALQAAIRFSSFHGGTVIAVHVMDSSFARHLKQQLGFSDAEMREAMRERLTAFIANCEAGTFYMDLRVETGNPAEELALVCERLGVDLLMLGNNGMEHRPRPLGEVAAQFAHRAPVHVLLVREGQNRVFDRVVACVDLSKEAEEVLAHAKYIAESDRAELDCLYVYRSAVAASLPYERHLPVPCLVASVETLEDWRRKTNEFVDRFAPKTERITPQKVVFEHGNVPTGICGYAEYRNADLVVIGASKRAMLRKMAFGTAAEEVVRHANCAVLVVGPNKLAHRPGVGERSLPNRIVSGAPH